MKKKSTQPESERARGDVPCAAAAAVLYAKTSALQKKEEKNMPFTHVSTSITLLFV